MGLLNLLTGGLFNSKPALSGDEDSTGGPTDTNAPTPVNPSGWSQDDSGNWSHDDHGTFTPIQPNLFQQAASLRNGGARNQIVNTIGNYLKPTQQPSDSDPTVDQD